MDYAKELIARSFTYTSIREHSSERKAFDFIARCIESCTMPEHIKVVRLMIQGFEVLHGPYLIEELATLLYIKSIMISV